MIEIRSYRRVFDLERRIYRVDRLRLNPGGVPVRGIVYFLAVLPVIAVLSRLPLLGPLLVSVPWYLRYLAAPGAASALLAVVSVEGRPSHLAALAIVRHRYARRRAHLRLQGLAPGRCWHPGRLLFLPDGSDGRMRRLLYSGPGAVLITREHVRGELYLGARRFGLAPRRAGGAVVVQERAHARLLQRREVISLRRGGRLIVRPAPPPRA